LLELEARAVRGALELELALEVGAGECLALVGPSGAGKTSALRIVAGLLRPQEGRVVCDGETWLDTARGVDLRPERRRCGYVFQDFALFGHLSAWRNVAYGLEDVPRGQRRAAALELLERFGVADRADARPGELSGGERQRVAVARALARRPHALLLDEPLSALDPRTRAAAARELHTVLREAGVPSLLVTHDFTEAALLGDRLGVLDRGRIVQVGTAAELAAAPASAFVADLAGAVVLTGVARAQDDGTTRVELDGGGAIVSTEPGDGPVAATVFPWEIALESLEDGHLSSMQNRLAVEVVSVTAIGGRARVGLAGPQPLTAEVSAAAVRELALAPGERVLATWKAAATRLVPLLERQQERRAGHRPQRERERAAEDRPGGEEPDHEDEQQQRAHPPG
jgi:molybdate transport system ATP-binding protein